MRHSLFAVSGLFALATAAALLSGCAADTASSEEGLDEEVVGDSEDALTANANFGYFIVTRQDMRKCVSPLCGGVFVKRVNQATTTCADGKQAAECYVSTLDLAGLGLDEGERTDFDGKARAGKALVKATMRGFNFNGTRLGKLRVTEAWEGAGGVTPTSTFYRAADNGIRCIKAPCPSLSATQLNSRDSHNLIRVGLDAVAGATQAERDAGANALFTEQGILVAGGIALPKCLPGSNCGPFLTAEEFYLRVTHKVTAPGGVCGGLLGRGCPANQYCAFPLEAMCGAADQTGTCATRPQACIQLFKPVCGCDGKTYSNSCMAASAGVSVSADGACK